LPIPSHHTQALDAAEDCTDGLAGCGVWLPGSGKHEETVMPDYDAQGKPINTDMPYGAIIGSGKKPETIQMHPVQLTSIVCFLETVSIVSAENLEKVEKSLNEARFPIFFMGMQVIQDPLMRNNEIIFKDAAGEIIGRIFNLAVPPHGK
jgi:hypothetical protein